MKTIVVAECGSSPAPEWNFHTWCLFAKSAGATHVKMQLFRAEHFPVGHQRSKKPLEFPRERFPEFVQIAHRYELKAGASVFDEEAVELAAQGDFLKLACREQYNRDLFDLALDTAERNDLPLYRSLDTWHNVLVPDNPYVTTLLTREAYPAPLSEMLAALVRECDVPRPPRWGYSSHTAAPGWVDVCAAVTLGAQVIEKHLSLTPNDREAGHSLTVEQFKRMVDLIGKVETP